GIITALADGGFRGQVSRVTSEDSFIPLGDAASEVLLSERAIDSAARSLMLATSTPPARPAKPNTPARPNAAAAPARPATADTPARPSTAARPARPNTADTPARPNTAARL